MQGLFGSLDKLGGTSLEFTCALCHTVHNPGLTKESEASDTTTLFLEVGDFRICEDCLPVVECLVVDLLPDAISFLEARTIELDQQATEAEALAQKAKNALHSHERAQRRADLSKAPPIDDIPF